MAFEAVLDQRRMSSNFIKASVVSEFCGRRDKLPSRINGVGDFLNTLSSRGLSRIEDLGQRYNRVHGACLRRIYVGLLALLY